MTITVIYFYHIGKTGGSSVKQNLKKINYYLSSNSEFYNFYVGKKYHKNDFNKKSLKKQPIVRLLKNNNYSSKYMIIHHHHGFVSIVNFKEELLKFKKKIENKGGRVFVFTVVREPISYVTSRMNYLTNDLNTDNFEKKDMFFEKNIDVQSKYLLHNIVGEHPHGKKIQVTKTDIINCLSLFDKVYLTENLNDIHADLKKIINSNIPWDYRKKNVSKKTMVFNDEEKEIILEKNKLDNFLYQKVVNNLN